MTGPLFDRIEALVLAAYPNAERTTSYNMPTFVVGGRKLHVGAWKHGVSFYGNDHAATALVRNHPSLKAHKATIQIRPEDAAEITDAEFLEFINAALG